jgi:hypothetical protein
MHTSVTNLAEWRTFRANQRLRLTQLLAFRLSVDGRSDAWSSREVLHHVLLVDSTTADLLDRLLKKAGELTPRDPNLPWPFRDVLMDLPLDTAFSVPAFRGTEPQAKVSDKTLEKLQREVGARHEALAERAHQVQLDAIAFPHPLAGKLNFYEWLVFGGIHERLHLTQLELDVRS